MNNIGNILDKRILLLDGAMGTMIQNYAPDETTFRGARFANHDINLLGCYDVLNITAQDIVKDIHSAYLDAGADIITTNTFNANAISLARYNLQEYTTEINLSAASLARDIADNYTALNPDKPRFVAGSVGPIFIGSTQSVSTDEDYAQLKDAYTQQITALIIGGVDVLLIETICEPYIAHTAIHAAEKVMKQTHCTIPIMLSVTTTPSGTMVSRETLANFIKSISHANILSVGINCSYGAMEILPHLRTLAQIAPHYISVHPNAGIPDKTGAYPHTTEEMFHIMQTFIQEELVNIIGGCCGTTPQLTALLSHAVEGATPHLSPNQ